MNVGVFFRGGRGSATCAFASLAWKNLETEPSLGNPGPREGEFIPFAGRTVATVDLPIPMLRALCGRSLLFDRDAVVLCGVLIPDPAPLLLPAPPQTVDLGRFVCAAVGVPFGVELGVLFSLPGLGFLDEERAVTWSSIDFSGVVVFSFAPNLGDVAPSLRALGRRFEVPLGVLFPARGGVIGAVFVRLEASVGLKGRVTGVLSLVGPVGGLSRGMSA